MTADKEMTMKQVTWWGGVDDERLTHSDPDEAIEAILDALHPAGFDEIGDVTVYEYRPVTVFLSGYFSPLEMLLESLDEEYANPAGDGHGATDAMKEAEQAFIAAVLAEYQPRQCVQTGKVVTVTAADWVREHRPHWLRQRE